MGGFSLIEECLGPYEVPIKVYQSESGIRVVTANTGELSSGLVNGFLVLKTEASSDDGCPHTLEHIIFMGMSFYVYVY